MEKTVNRNSSLNPPWEGEMLIQKRDTKRRRQETMCLQEIVVGKEERGE